MLQLARVQDQTNRHLQQHIQQGQVNMKNSCWCSATTGHFDSSMKL